MDVNDIHRNNLSTSDISPIDPEEEERIKEELYLDSWPEFNGPLQIEAKEARDAKYRSLTKELGTTPKGIKNKEVRKFYKRRAMLLTLNDYMESCNGCDFAFVDKEEEVVKKIKRLSVLTSPFPKIKKSLQRLTKSSKISI